MHKVDETAILSHYYIYRFFIQTFDSEKRSSYKCTCIPRLDWNDDVQRTKLPMLVKVIINKKKGGIQD